MLTRIQIGLILSLLLIPNALAQKITTATLPDGKVGSPYGFQLQGEGGKKPYRWYSASSLPMGLSLAQNGYLSGTPETPGTFTISLRMVTANNKTTSKTLSLSIAPSVPLSITTVVIPEGWTGKPYLFQIQVTGGTPPYDCQPEPDNNLAEFGLELDKSCLLFGVPTKAGEVHF